MPKSFFEVDLSLVEDKPLPDRWEKGSIDTMREYVQSLKTVQGMRSQGCTREDFRRLRYSSDPQEKALAQAYQNFYTEAPNGMRLDWDGSQYKINRGNHRVPLAKEAGLTYIPATVWASDAETLRRLEAAGRPVERSQLTSSPERPSAMRADHDVQQEAQNAPDTPLWERGTQQEAQQRSRSERI